MFRISSVHPYIPTVFSAQILEKLILGLQQLDQQARHLTCATQQLSSGPSIKTKLPLSNETTCPPPADFACDRSTNQNPSHLS